LFGADPKIGLSSSSIPKELLPQLETEEDLEQILADAGEGDTTDGTLWYREHCVWKYYSWIAPTLHGKTYPADQPFLQFLPPNLTESQT
jgi:hypothetical protein